jgi:hypothetical protein
VLADALSQAVPYPPELVLAQFPHDAPLLGAVALAIDEAGGQPSTTHPIIVNSNGHKGTKSTMNASSRPQGDLPAGAPEATSPSSACTNGTASPAAVDGQNSALKG